LLVIFLASNAVYADQVDVPFDYAQRFCEENLDGTYTCTWDPFGNVDTEEFTGGSGDPQPTEEVEPLVCPTDRFELNEAGDECIPIVSVNPELEAQIDKILTGFQQDKERFDKTPPVTSADKEYYELLKYQATCTRGTGAAEGIQQQDRYAVSTVFVNTDEAWLSSIEYTGRHAVLKKAIQECIWQHTILEPVTLGRQYLDIAAAQKPQMYHADVAAKVPIVSQERVNIEQNDNRFRTLDDAQRTLCRHDLYPQNIKESYKYCDLYKIPVIVNEVIAEPSTVYHRYLEYKALEHEANVSVRPTGVAGNPIANFIDQQGGYEKAIEAIKWRQHYDSTNQEEMEKPWTE